VFEFQEKFSEFSFPISCANIRKISLVVMPLIRSEILVCEVEVMFNFSVNPLYPFSASAPSSTRRGVL
jgi:hypothetical protein